MSTRAAHTEYVVHYVYERKVRGRWQVESGCTRAMTDPAEVRRAVAALLAPGGYHRLQVEERRVQVDSTMHEEGWLP